MAKVQTVMGLLQTEGQCPELSWLMEIVMAKVQTVMETMRTVWAMPETVMAHGNCHGKSPKWPGEIPSAAREMHGTSMSPDSIPEEK